MTDKEDTSSTKIIFFKGSESEWEDWSFGFLARAELGGYADILLGDTKAPSKQTLDSDMMSTTVTDAVKDKNKRLYALNGKAWAHLVTSMKTDTCQVAINILKSCQTTEHPNGDAYKGFTALKDHYQIKSVVTVQRNLTEFFDKKMKIRDNPGEFITEMDNLRAKIKDLDAKNEIKDDFFKFRILNMLPKEYDTTVQLLEEQLQADPGKVTIAIIRERLITQFKRMEGKSLSPLSSKSTNPSAETMLYAGGFKGQCGKCGKYGHKRRDCPERKKDVANVMTTPNNNGGNGNNNKQQRVVCSYCKKPGHTRQQCFKLQRQNNNNGGGGRTSHGNQSDKAEVVLTVVEMYTRLCICYRCEDVANYGFYGRACRVCLVGEYREPLPDGHGIGRCPHCHGIDELEAECVQCSDERGEMCVFDSFDTDSVHLDMITNVDTFPLLGTTLTPVHVDQSVIDRAANNDGNAILAIEAAIRRHIGAHPGRIDNPRPPVIPQFFPSDEMLSVPGRNDGTYFELLLMFIATHAGDHRYQLRQFLLQVGLWLLPPGNELTSELSATAYRFVRAHVYDLVNIGILTVSHLVHSILDVNDRLDAAGLRTFSTAELKMICRLTPVYLKAEFRWEERIDNPFPRRIVEQFPPAVRRKLRFSIMSLRDKLMMVRQLRRLMTVSLPLTRHSWKLHSLLPLVPPMIICGLVILVRRVT
jgi:gag-polypeptide of LTR copia-type/C2H2 zinc-finger